MANLSKAVCHGESDKCRFGNPPQESNFQRLGISGPLAAVHGGGKPALPLDTLFDGIAKNPAAPEYWWAYALLLSSMIPSLINLAIGGMALSRGIPGSGRLLLLWIPEGKAVPEYKRQPAAIGLTIQMFAGAFLGTAAQAFLAWGLIFHAMPPLGGNLLDMARAVAAFDLPMRIGQIFAGFLALK
jgi:hypothetical protein